MYFCLNKIELNLIELLFPKNHYDLLIDIHTHKEKSLFKGLKQKTTNKQKQKQTTTAIQLKVL